MMPLAVLLKKTGHTILGSDRAYDHGKTPEKFKSLQDVGISIVSQDGESVTDAIDYFVVSTAVENTIPDVKAAFDLKLKIISRGELLAKVFNQAKQKIAIAGTSGKSTVTGMIGTIISELGLDPTLVNGGEIINLRESKTDKFSGVRAGQDASDIFIAEMDESDGSIAHYYPSISVLNNIALDHKSLAELQQLFGDYLARTSDAIIVNLDQEEVKSLCNSKVHKRIISYGIKSKDADLLAKDICPLAGGISFLLQIDDETFQVNLGVPGKHNVENALGALAVCFAIGLDMKVCVTALEKFQGIHRRLEFIGTKDGISVIDDFAHNPDKISATLSTLKAFDGRLIVMFQAHGYGPLKLMGREIIESFSVNLGPDDVILMPEVYYAGGTVDRSVTAKDIINRLKELGLKAHWFSERQEIADFLAYSAKKGDRIVIMGARDDTLHSFAHEVLNLFG